MDEAIYFFVIEYCDCANWIGHIFCKFHVLHVGVGVFVVWLYIIYRYYYIILDYIILFLLKKINLFNYSTIQLFKLHLIRLFYLKILTYLRYPSRYSGKPILASNCSWRIVMAILPPECPTCI